MKLKSTLWALAFAVAAVSCSDDLEENGGGTGITAEDGEGVYLTVNIASPSGNTTKSAEDGDVDGGLEGEDYERKVHDVNIYLLEATSGDTGSGTVEITTNETGLKAVNAVGTTKIVGHGYSTDITETGQVNDHTANSVKITVDEVPSKETVYHVLAVVNVGEELPSFTTLGELRDAVKAPTTGTAIWDGSAWEGNGLPGSENTDHFVMSTHQMYDQSFAAGSSVTISSANTVPTNAATATVYVERLAARIDLKLSAGLKGTDSEGSKGAVVENPVIIEDSEKEAKDYVQLTGYLVVNDWKGDNYLLKRVSQTVNRPSTTVDYPAIPSPLTVSYLGNEVWSDVSNFNYNYVIDPNTVATATNSSTVKNSTNLSNLASSYGHHYDNSLNSDQGADAEMDDYTGVTDIKTDAFTPIIYTKENTLDLENQIYGLMTGVIFKGNYTPSAVSLYKSDVEGAAKVVASDYNAEDDFYVADFSNDDDSYYLCGDLKTIGVLSFENIKDEAYSTNLIRGLFDENTTDMGSGQNAVTLEQLKDAVKGIIGGKINAAYRDYLNGILNPATNAPTTIDATLIANMKWSKFLTETKINDPGTTNKTEDSKVLYDNYDISYYAGGVCYYPYWIRHENNNNNSVSAPMEFGIVRNNVYQLDVTGVKALGYPLPFTKPEDTKGEEENVYLTVELYVKNWVVRSNSGIIL